MNLKIGQDGNSFTSDQSVNMSKANVDIPYTVQIEQAGAVMHGLNEYAGGLQPPTLHVGVLPVNAYSTDVSESKVQEVLATYTVSTYCEIEYTSSYDFTHNHGTYVHPVMKVSGNIKPVDGLAGNEQLYNEFCYGYRAYVPEKEDTATAGTARR